MARPVFPIQTPPVSHLVPSENFHQYSAPDDSQPKCHLLSPERAFFATKLSPHSLNSDHPEESLPLNLYLWEVTKTPSARPRPQRSHPVPPPPGVLLLDLFMAPFLHSGAQPKCHLLREASSALCHHLHSHVTQVYYLQEHLFIYFAYCLFLPL